MALARKGIGEILIDKKFITPEQLAQARDVQKSAPGELGRLLVDLGFATERDVVQAKAEAEGLTFIDLTKHAPESSAVNVVPEHIVKKHNALPVKKEGPKLWVAMADPRNIVAVDDIRMVSRCPQVVPLMTVPSDLEDAIARAYAGSGGTGVQAVAPSSMMGDVGKMIAEMGPGSRGGGGGDDDDDSEGSVAAEAAPIIRMANAIIVQAVGSGASDIHIEPDRRGVRVRYRIDGVLHEAMTIPKHIQAPLISRYKIMTNSMDIAERRIPQDGRIPIRHEGKDYDMRVSCLPSLYGEKIVMRILDKSSVLLGLNRLGFAPDVQMQLEELTLQPNGMMLVTGPTGSGKTTTLYSVLNKISSIEKNIITVEDPIEYQLGGITQVAVNKKAGLNFGNALRSFLRQDPDIIMVGEMRDLETAEIAIEAALTGHLVLSTLHTNDAPSATIRLADMGVEPFLISATVIGILAQRLTRKICTNCKEPYKVNAEELRRFGFVPEDPDQEVTLFRGRGCEICRNKGYKGRLGVYELLRVNEEIAELVVRRAPLADIKDAAKANGMKEMKEDGLQKVLEGITTPEEVMRVVFTAGH